MKTTFVFRLCTEETNNAHYTPSRRWWQHYSVQVNCSVAAEELKLGSKFNFRHYNTQTELQRNGFDKKYAHVLEWPSQSPDVNPIKWRLRLRRDRTIVFTWSQADRAWAIKNCQKFPDVQKDLQLPEGLYRLRGLKTKTSHTLQILTCTTF